MSKFRVHSRWWLVSTCLLAAMASQAFSQQYPFILIPGSPKGMTSLFQDSRGRLWLAGPEPACFDGTRFFLLREYGLPQGYVHDYSEDSSGVIWIGGETGVYRFVNGHAEEVASEVATSVIAASPDLAVATAGPPGRGIPLKASLLRIQRAGGRWKSEVLMGLNSPGPITLDRAGMLLYAEPTKGWNEVRLEDVARVTPGAKISIVRHPRSRFADNGNMKVMRDRFGCVWMGFDGGSFCECGKGFQPVPFAGLSTLGNLHEGADGNVIVFSPNSLAVGRPGAFRVATRANGLPGIRDALQGRDGTIWLIGGEGLYRFPSPFRSEYWTVRDGVSNPPWSIARSGKRIYAGLEGNIVVLRNDRSRWDTFTPLERNTTAWALLGTEGGSLLASLDGDAGAVQFGTDGNVLARTAKNRPHGSNMRLARGANGEIWWGGSRLERLTRSGSVLKSDEHPLQSSTGNILSVRYEELTHRLWACSSEGLIEKDERGEWKEFSTRDGLSVNGCWSLAPLPTGDVWYAYYHFDALALIRPSTAGGITVRNYRPTEGNPYASDTIDADQRGWLWRSSDSGIYVASATDAENGRWLQLDQADGFPANDMNSGSVFVDNDGSLWWGADNDLAHYVPPRDLVAPKFAPEVFVSAFSIDGAPPRMAETTADFPHGSKVAASIGSLQFDRRNNLRLRYRILPEQTSWLESNSLNIPLGALPAGVHTLEVQARVFTGPWSRSRRRVYTVLRPVWLSVPLLLLYGVTVSFLGGGGYVWHRRRKAENAELLPDLEVWRLEALMPEVYDLAGVRLDGRFEVGELLARGGFANVMAGYDHEQRQPCAVKVFRNEVKDTAWIQRRFDQEVAALRQVRHPNVVAIYAHGNAPNGAPYLIMEFVEGVSLREVLRGGPLRPSRAARFLRQLASALDAIHALEIWHRDVKPENVMVRREGSPDEEAVLIDFSIAIVKNASETLYGLSRAAGSFEYMAPEQVIGYAEPSSDIYSLAKVGIEMLTGARLSDLLPNASLDLPERASELMRRLNAGLSEESVGALSSALEYDPAKRPRAAGTFVLPLVRDLESGDRGAEP